MHQFRHITLIFESIVEISLAHMDLGRPRRLAVLQLLEIHPIAFFVDLLLDQLVDHINIVDKVED